MRYLDPKNDITFKKVFGVHKDLCMSLLNALVSLPDDAKITSIEYEDTSVLPTTEYNKNSVVDVKCVDSLGRHFIVEMQLYWSESFMSRALLNAAKTYVNQTKKGQHFNTIKPVYSLCLLNDIFLKGDKYKNEFIHHYALCNDNHSDLKIEGIEFVFVEMPKFKAGCKASKTDANNWMSFLNDVDGKESIDELPQELVSNPLIKKAIDCLEESSYTSLERAYYDKYWDAVSRELSSLDDAENRGIKKGRAEGLVEGAINERISNIVALRNVLPPEKIAEAFHIDISEVLKILKEM